MLATPSWAGFFGRLLLRGLSLGRRRTFPGFLRRGGFLLVRRGGRRLLFCGLFVGIASIVCSIKSRSLEDQTCAGTKQSFHLAMSPFRQPAKLFRAFAKRLVAHRLECVEVLAALLTRILVRWHQKYESVRFSDDAGKSALNIIQFNPRQTMN